MTRSAESLVRWFAVRLVFTGLVLLAGTARPGEPERARHNPRLTRAPESGWSQWRGPYRDGISDETGLLQEWPDDGPRELWRAEDLGRGYSAPIIVGGRLYLTGEVGDDLRVFALDLGGHRVWQSVNGRAWKGPYPGARAACTYRDGWLFHLNAHGRLAALEAATGQERWAVNVLERFGGKNLTWALSECLLVDGERVMVTAGGEEALMAALNVKTGATVWSTPPLRLGPSPLAAQERVREPPGAVDPASYASPILFSMDDRRWIVNCSLHHVFGVDAETGELGWTRPLPTRYGVIAATPVLIGDAVFVTAPDSGGGSLYRLRLTGAEVDVERLWRTPLDTCHGGVVYVNGALFGSWYRSDKGWACVDPFTGRIRYKTDALAMGSVLYADQRLYCLSQEGEMALLDPRSDRFEFAGRFPFVTAREKDVWTHPVIHDGRLYLRYHEQLRCYDIRRPGTH